MAVDKGTEIGLGPIEVAAKRPPKGTAKVGPITTAPRPPRPPSTGDPAVEVARFADALAVGAHQLVQTFKNLRPEVILPKVPDSVYWATAVKAEPALAYVEQDVTQFLGTIYGGDHLAAAMSAQLFRNPEQREYAMQVLARLRNAPQLTLAQAGGYARGLSPSFTSQYALGTSGLSDEELIRKVMEDPDYINQITPRDKSRVSGLAAEVLASLQELPQDAGLVQAFNRAMAVGATGDARFAVTPEQIELFRTMAPKEMGELGGLRQTGETPTLSSIGIEQVRQLGEGVYVLNSEWARIDPAGAYAIKLLIEQEDPGAQIQWDRNGIVGSFFDKWGSTVDLVTAPFMATLNRADESIEYLTTSEADRRQLLARADELERQLGEGTIPVDRVERTLATIHQLRDEGTIDIGIDDWKADVFRNANPSVIGHGVAESGMRLMELHPGDWGYELAYNTWFIVGNIMGDPVGWKIQTFAGSRAARTVQKYHFDEATIGSADDIARDLREFQDSLSEAESLRIAENILEEGRRTGEYVPIVSRRFIEQEAYRRLARFPEEMAVTRPHARAQRHVWRALQTAGPDRLAAGLVQKWGVSPDVARFITSAQSEADMGISLTTAQMGHRLKPQNMNELMSRLETVQSEMRQGVSADRVAELIVEETWLDSVIRGEDFTRPLRQLPTSKDLRRLERYVEAPFGRVGNVIMKTQDFVEQFPANMLRNEAARRLAAGDTRLVEQARSWFATVEHMYRPTGAGGLIIGPHVTRGSGAMRRLARRGEVLVDSPDKSLEDLMNLAGFMGLPRRRVQELFGPWARDELTTSQQFYRWWNNAWEAMVDESPILPGFAKDDLRRWSDSFVMERSPGYISVADETGATVPRPTLYTTITNPRTGATIRQGVPAFSADMVQGVRAPMVGDLRQLSTMWGRTMEAWERAGTPSKRFVSRSHATLATTHTAANSLWKSIILMGKMPSALPLRIFGEQQVRIAAFGFSSLFNHPVEWFLSTRVGSRMARAWGDDVGLFTDSPIEHLGGMVDNLDEQQGILLHSGRKDLTLNAADPGEVRAYFRAYSKFIEKYFKSEEVHHWHMPYLGDAQRALDSIQNGKHADLGKEWLRHYDEIAANGGTDTLTSIQNTHLELQQMIGEGPGADKIRAAIRRGSAEFDGEVITAGTSEFADAIERMYHAGEWAPQSTFLPAHAAEYLPWSRRAQHGLIRFRDFMFRNFYTRPDLAFSRSALYRQMAKREFRNRVRRGYSPANAARGAQAYAARGTADYMFTLGAKTSGEYFLRNISPFFPAFRELATTWLKRVPQAMGGGSWLLGAGLVARRGDVWLDFFKNQGWVREDERGNLFVPIPGLAEFTSFVTGADVKFVAETPLESIAGLLPNPAGLFKTEDEEGNPLPWHERARGLMPSLGAIDALLLARMSDLLGGKLDWAEDAFTLFGAEQSLGPIAWDRLWEAHFDQPLPWVMGQSRTAHENQQTWAKIDGARIYMMNNPMPDFRDFDEDGDGRLSEEEDAELRIANRAYVEELALASDRYATNLYMIRGFSSMLLPFSLRLEDEGKSQMQTLWATIDALPDDERGRFGSAIISGWLAENPQLEGYMTGKTLDMSLAEDPNRTLDEYMDMVAEHPEMVRSFDDWVVFSMGMNSYGVFQSRLNEIYEEAAGEPPADWLANFDAKEALEVERLAFEDFKDWSTDVDNFLPDQTQSFMDMLNVSEEYRARRDGDSPRLSRAQEALLDFNTQFKEYAKYFSPNPESADDYFAMREAAFEALRRAGGSAISQAQNWWFEQVSDGYYDKLDKLYTKLDRTNQRDHAPIFQEIRDLAAEYHEPRTNPEHPEWGEFRSPEELLFTKMSNKDQETQLTQWADLPPEFLTEFQREQVGYTVPEGKQDDANELARLVTMGNYRLKKWAGRNDVSPSSNVYKDAKKRFDDFYAQTARERGLGAFWKEMNAPAYERVGNALNLGARTEVWAWAVDSVDELRRRVEAAGYSPSGTSDLALSYHKWTAEAFRVVRRENAEFDRILNELSIALGEPGNSLTHDDLVSTLFWDDFDPGDNFFLD